LFKFAARSPHPLYNTLYEDAMRLFDSAEPLDLMGFPE
jgi:hypothetical protein